MKTIATWLALLLSAGAHANTFVGNGGGQGDVELTVTLLQIQETFTAIDSKSGSEVNLCECNKMYQGRPICEPVATLNEVQGKFCNKGLYKVTPAILKLITNRSNIHFNWTNEQIEVNEGGQLRAVDAVANRDKREIIINQPRFLHMTPAERVFLLTHELMHFTEWDGKAITDKGPIGPFTGEDGSREFINAMAASAAVMQGAYPKEIKRYKAKLSRSQAWKHFWVATDFGGANPERDYADKFQFNSYGRAQMNLRYQWTHWGIQLTYRKEWQDGSVLGDIKTEEQIDSIGIGPTYRIFVSSDPLTFWGQSHILIHTLIEGVQSKYSYHEDVAGGGVVKADDQATVLGANVGVSYYVPLFYGMWAYVGLGYEYHPYKYKKPDVNLNFNNNLYSGNIGVGYAF